MQRQERKRRSHEGHEGTRISEGSRFRYSIALISCCFLISCSHPKKQSEKPVLATTQMKKICWSSEGRGRLHSGRNRYLFSYESLHNQPQKTWSLGLEIPVHGEEILSLDYTGIERGQFRVKGGLFNRLRREMVGTRDRLGAVKQFVRHLGAMIDSSSRGLVPDGYRIVQSTESILVAEASLGSGEKVRLAFSDPNHDAEDGAQGTYFQRQMFELHQKSSRGRPIIPLKLNFFLRDCSGK